MLAEWTVSTERVRRATERIGDERVVEQDAQAAAYAALPIPTRRAVPPDQPTPAVSGSLPSRLAGSRLLR